jgi:hypothetical protein
MRDQIIHIEPFNPARLLYRQGEETAKAVSYPDAAFWIQVYPPLSDHKSIQHAKALCPWSMAAELTDISTTPARRQNILECLKRGLKIMRQYDLPANRIVFMEHYAGREISVWVD